MSGTMSAWCFLIAYCKHMWGNVPFCTLKLRYPAIVGVNAMAALLDTAVWYHIIFVVRDYCLANHFTWFNIKVNGQYKGTSNFFFQRNMVLYTVSNYGCHEVSNLFDSLPLVAMDKHGWKATDWLLSFSWHPIHKHTTKTSNQWNLIQLCKQSEAMFVIL